MQQEKFNPTIGQMTAQLRTAAIDEQQSLMASLVLAFSSDPAVRWMYPSPDRYLTDFPRFVKAMGSQAFERETAYCIDNYAGAALWFPPGVEPNVDAIVEVVEESIGKSEQTDVFAMFEQMEQYHPKEPHWYLPILGVEPNQQGKGYGSALLQHVLQTCDRDRIPAYLEASKPANVPFYERHGFKVVSTIQAGKSPSIFPMIRQPSDR
jgi:GNAT superfamily N-acetyltransferase